MKRMKRSKSNEVKHSRERLIYIMMTQFIILI